MASAVADQRPAPGPSGGWRWLAAGLLGLLLMLAGRPAGAHPMPESQVWVDSTEAGLTLTLQLPLNRLEFAYGQPLAEQPQAVLPAHADGLARYLMQHVGARSGLKGEGAGWTVLRPQLRVDGEGIGAELHAVLPLVAPAGADRRRLSLLYDVITHEVKTHRVQLFLRSDWAGGRAAQAPLLLGELNSSRVQWPLELAAPAPGASWLSLLKAGAWHIAEGSDHLLFLWLLLIVAPLAVAQRQWGPARPVPSALRHVAWVVTAFTGGHSLTLLLGSSGLLRVPVQPVEVAVAGTIMVAALHAWRPWFGSREVAMAGGFGLIHGLAFSASLNGAGLSAWQHAQALLAFNLGIELMQLALVLLVLPLLLLSVRRWPRAHRAGRLASAAAAGCLAAYWVVERLGS